jgi:hypothetical protein
MTIDEVDEIKKTQILPDEILRFAFNGKPEIITVPDGVDFAEFSKTLKREDNIRIIIIPDNDEMAWAGGAKTDPTQFSEDLNAIEIKSSFNYKNDPEKWMVHEVTHALASRKDFLYKDGISNYADNEHPYPTNEIEQYAYKTQFSKLIQNGVDIETIMTDPKFKTLKIHFEHSPEVMNKYYTEALQSSTRHIDDETTANI